MTKWGRARLEDELAPEVTARPWQRHPTGWVAIQRPDGYWLYVAAWVSAEGPDELVEMAE